MKILIVGGVAGGASAAARLRRLSEENEIIMFERGDYISFANCGLPYHIGNVIKNKDSLLIETVEGMKEKFNIDVRIKTEVLSINRDLKKIKVINLEDNKEYEESYDKLILSPGANPFIPNVKGVESDKVFTLRNINDMDKIIEKVKHSKRAIVVGAGFIGLEMAENLKHINIETIIIERDNQVMAPVDFEIASIAHDEIKSQGVGLYLSTELIELQDNGNEITAILNNGEEIKTDIVIMSVGVKPEIKLAKDANLEIGKLNGIKVNDELQTNDKDIYAIGDAIEVKHYITQSETLIPLAWPANRQGRLVAGNVLGEHKTYKGTLGTSIAKVFDLTVSTTGLNEKQLKRLNIEYENIIVTKMNHAGYYPNASNIVLKLLYRPTGEILGAQAIGHDGVDKRIDIISTAIRGDIKAWDLQEIEVAYAPPFNSAKDIVNYVGYIAENKKENHVDQVEWSEIEDLKKEDSNVILDVRTKVENRLGDIEGALIIPLNELRNRLNELSKDKTYIVYCKTGQRSYLASKILKNNGFKVKNLNGGYSMYEKVTSSQDNKIKFNNNEVNSLNVNNTFSEKVNGESEIELDTCGLQCPGPILKVKEKMNELLDGQTIKILSTDMGFQKDIEAWAKKTGNTVISNNRIDGKVEVRLQKNSDNLDENKGIEIKADKNNTTMVVFSGDFDKVFASMIIANGAIAMGREVSIFFTFWGLNALRKSKYKEPKKSIIETAFSKMMPKGMSKLGLSKMNFGGLGRKMMDHVMKEKNIESLESLLNQYMNQGGKIIACTMSMDVMGITKEELIDGIEYGGVATYLGDVDNANQNLFI